MSFSTKPNYTKSNSGPLTMPVLYRGIALDEQTADADCIVIRRSGQLAAKSWWKNTMANPTEVRLRMSKLARVPNEIRDKISQLPQLPLTYSCGDFEGAARYALRGSGIPFVITFEIALEDVIIDGKDFLYTVFQLWDRHGSSHRDRIRENLSSLFGPTMLGWFDLACRESDSGRIGLCDLAVHDLAAIKHHHANRIDIAGRIDRVFHSSFALPATLGPAAILDIKEVGAPPPDPGCTIHFRDDMLKP
jgi:hypothetical protein